MDLAIPELCLVVLVGPSGSGKSTFAAVHFKPTEVISSDHCRALVSDDENNLAATPAAFRVLHSIAGERLRSGRLTVIDATSVQPDARKPLIALAHEHGSRAVAIVLGLPESVCIERNRQRPQRNLAPRVVRRQHRLMRRSIENIEAEGFHRVFVLDSTEAVETAAIVREPLASEPIRPRDNP